MIDRTHGLIYPGIFAGQSLLLRFMELYRPAVTTIENHILSSVYLDRDVVIDCYLPSANRDVEGLSLLLINDGQDLPTMPFTGILDDLYARELIKPIFAVGIYCSTDRKNEYGTALILDYKGRGAKASLYTQFVMEELLPFLRKEYAVASFTEKMYAGFSLGGLCALDIVWNHPHEFTCAGIFSGSLWWRDKDQDDPDFDEDNDRIMHRQVREGAYHPWLRFFFEVGTQDETADRNNNGVIDSIDDTLSLIQILRDKGYTSEESICYLELSNGRHDVPTWASAFPTFLTWAFKTQSHASSN